MLMRRVGDDNNIDSNCAATYHFARMSATLPPGLDAWRMVSACRVFEGWLDVSAMPRLAAALVSDAGRCRYAAEFGRDARSEEHTSELQSLMRISYAVFCLKKKNTPQTHIQQQYNSNDKMIIK